MSYGYMARALCFWSLWFYANSSTLHNVHGKFAALQNVRGNNVQLQNVHGKFLLILFAKQCSVKIFCASQYYLNSPYPNTKPVSKMDRCFQFHSSYVNTLPCWSILKHANVKSVGYMDSASGQC